jgi:hypothetical protein
MEESTILLAVEAPLLKDLLKRTIQKTAELILISEENVQEDKFSFAREVYPTWLVITLPDQGIVPEKALKLLQDHIIQGLFAINIDGKEVLVRDGKGREDFYDDLTLSQMQDIFCSNFLGDS